MNNKSHSAKSQNIRIQLAILGILPWWVELSVFSQGAEVKPLVDLYPQELASLFVTLYTYSSRRWRSFSGWGCSLVGRCGSNNPIVLRVEVGLFQRDPDSSSVIEPFSLCQLLLGHAANGRSGHGKYLVAEGLGQHLKGWVASVERKKREHWVQVEVCGER